MLLPCFPCVLQILDLSKIEAGKIEIEESDVDIRESVASAIDVVAQKALGKGIDIFAKVSPRVPYFIRCDSSRLRQVLFNLLSNSVKFTSAGQVIMTVDATRVVEPSKGSHPLSTSHVSVNSAAGAKYNLRIEVIDSGIGISPSAQKRLFTSFSQAHREINGKYGGTGSVSSPSRTFLLLAYHSLCSRSLSLSSSLNSLGLAISKSLIELFGGKIGLESEVNVGSKFFIDMQVSGTLIENMPPTLLPPYLQLVHHTPYRPLLDISESISPTSATVLPPRRLLLVHHNTAIASLLQAMFEEWNWSVTHVRAFGSYKKQWQIEGQVAEFSMIWYDVASVYVHSDEASFLPQLHQLTRGLAVTLIALLPIGSNRRAHIETITDGIVTQPIKPASAYAACSWGQSNGEKSVANTPAGRSTPKLPNSTPSGSATPDVASPATISTTIASLVSPRSRAAAARLQSPGGFVQSLSPNGFAGTVPPSMLSSIASLYPVRVLVAGQ